MRSKDDKVEVKMRENEIQEDKAEVDKNFDNLTVTFH